MPYMTVRENGRTKRMYVSLYSIPHFLVDKRKAASIQDPNIRLQKIAEEITSITGIPYKDICGTNRKREIRVARQVFCYVACHTTSFTYSSIAKFIKKHHSTVMHSKDEIAEKVSINDSMVMDILKHIKHK